MLTSDIDVLSNADDEFETSCKGSAECIAGIITRIVDGYTLDIEGTRVRLALVNSPESGKPGYDDASQFTATLCPVGSIAIADEDDLQL